MVSLAGKMEWRLSDLSTLGPWLDRSGPLRDLRADALGWLMANGFPTSRHEDWLHTNPGAILESVLRPVLTEAVLDVDASDVVPYKVVAKPTARLVFINGRYSAARSETSGLPTGVRVDSLARLLRGIESVVGSVARYQDDSFSALNTAFIRDGACVLVSEGTIVERPIELLYLRTGGAVLAQPRNLLVLGKGSRLNLIETWAAMGGEGGFSNSVTEIVLREDSQLQHCKLQIEDAHHVATTHARQSSGSSFSTTFVALGGQLVRNNVLTTLARESAKCSLDGLTLTDGDQHVDNRTVIEHAKPNGTSREHYRAILGGSSRGIFNGKIIVRQAAQKTDAQQATRNLLLSDSATAEARPHLEIYADDVKCSHGAAIGRLDEESVFYLRSRGIGEAAARAMLTRAFAGVVLAGVQDADVRGYLDRWVEARVDRLMVETR